MPASSSSTTSCQRFACREPGALVCASSSSRSSAGCGRARRPGRTRGGACPGTRPRAGQSRSRPSARAAVSARPWVSTQPMTTSTPSALLRARRLEHGVGLADAGRGAEEDLEAAAGRAGLLGRHAPQEGIGIRPLVAHPRVSRQTTPRAALGEAPGSRLGWPARRRRAARARITASTRATPERVCRACAVAGFPFPQTSSGSCNGLIYRDLRVRIRLGICRSRRCGL